MHRLINKSIIIKQSIKWILSGNTKNGRLILSECFQSYLAMSPRQRRVRAGRVGTSDEAGFRGTGTTLPYDKSEYSGSHSHRLHPRDSESAPCPLQVNYKKKNSNPFIIVIEICRNFFRSKIHWSMFSLLILIVFA